MKFILPINVKMSTIVGILTFISRINTISDGSKTRKQETFHHFSFYELKFHAQLSCVEFEKSLMTSGLKLPTFI